MTIISEKILETIKNDHIAPVPRWHFLVRSCVFWALFGFSVILGSLAFSVMVHIANSIDMDMLSHLQGNLFVSTVMLLPYFWAVFLFLFALVSYYNWKHTKHGYRIKRRWIFLGSIVLSMFLGSAFYFIGLGRGVDSIMIKAMPMYNASKHRARLEIWQQPEKGLIIGRILDVNVEGNNLIIQDGKGNSWNVGNDVKNKTKEKIHEIVKKGAIVKIVGNENGPKGFIAKDIRACGDCDGDSDDYGAIDDDSDKN